MPKLTPERIIDRRYTAATGGGGIIAGAGSGSSLSAHALDSIYHVGTLGDDQGPQFALLDGSRTYTGNIVFSGAETVDGVDVSVFYAAYLSHEHDARYYTKTQLDGGQLDTRYYTETESDARYYTKTQLDGGQLDTRYYTKTQLDGGQLDTRYYTETESDARFVRLATAGTITARHTFNPASAESPFILGANAQGQLVTGLNSDLLDGYEASAFPRKAENATIGGTWTFGVDLALASGALINFADAIEDKILYYSTSYGVGIESSTLTHWSGSQHRWRTGGTSASSGTQRMILNTTGLKIGSSGTASAALDVAGDAVISGGAEADTLTAATSVSTPLLQSTSAIDINSNTGTDASQIDQKINGTTVARASNLGLGSAAYTSQSSGWNVSPTGGADFRYLFVDEMHAKSFIADLEQALAGGQIISKSVAMVATAFTAPAAGGTATLRVRDLPSAPNMQAFQANDVVRLRTFSRSGGSLTIGDCWGVVTSYADQSDGTQTWTFTRSSAPNAGAMTSGTVVAADSLVLDYGTSGNGIYEVNAIDGAYGANSPYWRIISWSGHPATGSTERARGGKLTGIFGTANEYGVAAGTGFGASDAYVRYSNATAEQNNVASTWRAGGTPLITINPTYGISLQSFDATSDLIIYGDQRIIEWASSLPSTNPDGAIWAQYTTTQNELYVEARQTGSRAGAIRLIAYGEAATGNYSDNVFVTLAGAESSATRSYLSVRADDVEIDLGNGSANIGDLTLYSAQLLISDGSSSDDGSAANPVYSFLNDPDTGIYRSAANTLNFATGGSNRLSITTTAINAELPIYAKAGEGIRVVGAASGATSTAYMAFYDSSGARQGWVGDGSTANQDIYLVSDNGAVRVRDSSGVDALIVSGGTVTAQQPGTSAAVPPLALTQSDLSEGFIDFQTTVGTGNAIDTAALGTYYGKIRVSVNGTLKYIALYNS